MLNLYNQIQADDRICVEFQEYLTLLDEAL